MIRVVLPLHLKTLANVSGEIQLEVAGEVTQRSILDALESNYPMLRGTLRDHATRKRRPRIRYFAMAEDVTHQAEDEPLAEAIATGAAPFLIVGAISGG